MTYSDASMGTVDYPVLMGAIDDSGELSVRVGGQIKVIPRHVALRSPVLQTTVGDIQLSGELPLPVPTVGLEVWLQVLSRRHLWTTQLLEQVLEGSSCAELLNLMEAADMLGDLDSTEAACNELGRRLWNLVSEENQVPCLSCSLRGSGHACVRHTLHTDEMVLNNLSSDLQMSVMRAAPDLDTVLATLPQTLHPTALRSWHTSIDTTSSFNMQLGRSDSSDATATVAALHFLTQLTSVSFSEQSICETQARPRDNDLVNAMMPAPVGRGRRSDDAVNRLSLDPRPPGDAIAFMLLDVSDSSSNRGKDVTSYSTRQQRSLSVFQSISSLPRLQSLSLEHLAIGAAGSTALACCLSSLPALRRISLDSTDVCMCEVAPAFEALTSLQSLKLTVTADSCVGMHSLKPSALVGRIESAGLQFHGAAALARHISALRALTELDVSGARIGDRGWEVLLEGMHTMPELQALWLGGNNLTHHAPWARALQSTAQNGLGTRLAVLDVRENIRIGEGCVRVLQALPALKKVNLRQTGIFPQIAHLLPTVLAPMTKLQVLILSENAIRGPGMVSIAPCLAQLTCLVSLDLNGNGIGDTGACALAESLVFMLQLRWCRLGSNRIAGYGAGELAAAFEVLPAVRWIDLTHNMIGDEGAQAFRGRLQVMKALQVLSLAGNDISSGEEHALRGACGGTGKCIETATQPQDQAQLMLERNLASHVR